MQDPEKKLASRQDHVVVAMQPQSGQAVEEDQLAPRSTILKKVVFRALLGTAALALLSHQLAGHFGCHHGKHSQAIDWQPCWEDKTVLCGTFEVLTDYDNPSMGVTKLSVSKIPATVSKKDRLGSVMANYGGPGVPGRSASFTLGRNLFGAIGGRYDLISWDGRGLGRTVPNVQCHSSAAVAAVYKANTVLESTFEVPTDPFSKEGRGSLIEQQKEALGLIQGQAEICGESLGADVLKYMGTTTLIKDMERLSEALEGKDAPINFIGGSYGTIVAEYLINMLPNKIGRVVAHGVASPPDWTGEHYENYKLLGMLLGDAEKSYRRFAHECFAAGAADCALTRPGDKSGEDVSTRINSFIKELHDNPKPVIAKGRNAVLRSGMVRSQLFEAMQFPAMWGRFAGNLADAMKGNASALVAGSARIIPYHPEADPDGFISIGQSDLGRLAVSCADMPPYVKGEPFPTAEVMINDLLKVVKEVSPTFGATVNLMEQHGGCQFWPRSESPVERFEGPWNSTLANPILVLSNSHDPITPAVSGREMAERYPGQSRHVIQNATGHSYLVPFSNCMTKITHRYYNEGKLPKDFETFCQEAPKSNFPGTDESPDFPHLWR